MMYKTHLATSIAVGAGIAKIAAYPFTIGYLSGIAFGSLLPDIDEPRSFIGRRSFGISEIINKRYGHRGITHSLFFWAIMTLLLLLIPNQFFIGISLGYLFHITGDYFSKSGVPLFKPFNNERKKFPLFTYKTSSSEEKIIYIIAILIALALTLNKDLLVPLLQSSEGLIASGVKITITLLKWILTLFTSN